MIIGIDGNEANVEKKVGISEYAYQLLVQFHQTSQITFYIYLKNVPRDDMPEENVHWKYIIVKPRKLWTQIGLPFYLFTHFPRPNIFFTPTHYAPRFSPVPTAISVMDLSFLHYTDLFAKKDLYQLTSWTKYSVKNASRVFTISQASKNDILDKYNIPNDKVIVTYPGIKQIAMGTTKLLGKKDLEKKFGIAHDYVLFVGTLQPRKNIEKLIEAFSIIKKEKGAKDLELVLVGKKGWLYENILKAPEKFGVEKDVKFLEFVNDEDLPSLYKHALFFILPSLYEGFGLPVVEAMKYGTPVITSNVSSLPEAGGDAALYVDPLSTEDIAQKMKKLLESPTMRANMIKKGYAHIKKFSWEKAAKETLSVLEQLGEKNAR